MGFLNPLNGQFQLKEVVRPTSELALWPPILLSCDVLSQNMIRLLLLP